MTAFASNKTLRKSNVSSMTADSAADMPEEARIILSKDYAIIRWQQLERPKSGSQSQCSHKHTETVPSV